MSVLLHNEVLDRSRKALLRELKFLKDRFYLAGGTALALQIGHRISIDFDYFTQKKFDNFTLFNELTDRFSDRTVEKIQDNDNTLSIILDQKIKLSFFCVSFPAVLPLLNSDCFKLLPVKEIGAMKIAALPRAAYRDYVDIYFILQKYKLSSIFELAEKKYSGFDPAIYLKCLTYYEDIEFSPVKFKSGFNIRRNKVFEFLELKAKSYLRGK